MRKFTLTLVHYQAPDAEEDLLDWEQKFRTLIIHKQRIGDGGDREYVFILKHGSEYEVVFCTPIRYKGVSPFVNLVEYIVGEISQSVRLVLQYELKFPLMSELKFKKQLVFGKVNSTALKYISDFEEAWRKIG